MVTGLRPPSVAGVAGGVGTTTLAVALRARDEGRAGVAAADILACRATVDSLRRATAVLDRADRTPGPAPVLAVTLGGARIPRGQLQARLDRLEAATSGVVVLPHVAAWALAADPLAEAADLLLDPDRQLPRPLRAYAAALRELAAAVAASGRLARAGRPRAPDRPGVPPRVAPGAVRSAPGAGIPPRVAPGPDTTAPRVVRSFQPVLAPEPGPPPVPRPRGIRVVTAPRRPARIEQVG